MYHGQPVSLHHLGFTHKNPIGLFIFFIGFWIITENKLCDPQQFHILTCFVHRDNLHKWTQLLYEFWSLNTITKSKPQLLQSVFKNIFPESLS